MFILCAGFQVRNKNLQSDFLTYNSFPTPARTPGKRGVRDRGDGDGFCENEAA